MLPSGKKQETAKVVQEFLEQYLLISLNSVHFFIILDDQITSFIRSIDGVPFLMHDKTFRRTTNIADVFPDRVDESASMFNISDIKKLNAGQWFIDVSLFIISLIKPNYVENFNH